jgi:hypothetical protein
VQIWKEIRKTNNEITALILLSRMTHREQKVFFSRTFPLKPDNQDRHAKTHRMKAGMRGPAYSQIFPTANRYNRELTETDF